MSISHASSQSERQRPSRNWITDTLIVAGILAFGYFAVTMETGRQQASSPTRQAAQSPLDLLR